MPSSCHRAQGETRKSIERWRAKHSRTALIYCLKPGWDNLWNDVHASKGERDRSYIGMQDKAAVSRWLRHFGVTKNQLQRAVEKIGNSVVAVRKQMGIDCNAEPFR